MIELLFDNDKARRRTRHAATPKLSTASIRRCSCRSPDRLGRRAGMAAISRGAMTSARLPSRKGLIVGIGRLRRGSAEKILHHSREAAGGLPSGPRGVGGVPRQVCASVPRSLGRGRRRDKPAARCGAPGGMCRASAGACKHAGLTARVDQRVPALLEELDRYPDDRAEIVRAAWAVATTEPSGGSGTRRR